MQTIQEIHLQSQYLFIHSQFLLSLSILMISHMVWFRFKKLLLCTFLFILRCFIVEYLIVITFYIFLCFFD